MKIYFAHPKDTYNTEYELNCLTAIDSKYPGCEIVNPRDIPIEEEDKNPKGYVGFITQMEKYYFSAIESCDIMIVAKTNNGKVSPGVQKEVEFATRKKIPVEYLDVVFPENNKPTLTCYYCGIQFVVEDKDIAPEEKWEKDNRAATSEYSLQNEDDIWRDSCSACNGTDPCFGCEYIDTCIGGHMGGTEKIAQEKCQAYIPGFDEDI